MISNKNKKILVLFFSIGMVAIFGYVFYAHAVMSPYAPGQTLDPNCHPGDFNCTVEPFTGSGDISGSTTQQTVVGIEGRPVTSTTPISGQVLQWNGSSWAPATPTSTGPQGLTGATGPQGPTGVGNAGNWFTINPPDFSTATWVNQNTASYEVDGGIPVISTPFQSTSQFNNLVYNIPGSTYTITMVFSESAPILAGSYVTGIILEDDSQKAVDFFVNWFNTPGTAFVTQESQAGVQGTEAVELNNLPVTGCQVRGFKIVEDGVHRTYYYSCDGGTAWAAVYQEASNTYVTPTKYGVVTYNHAAGTTQTTVYNLQATTP